MHLALAVQVSQTLPKKMYLVWLALKWLIPKYLFKELFKCANTCMVSLETYAIWGSDRGPVTTTYTRFILCMQGGQIKITVIDFTWIYIVLLWLKEKLTMINVLQRSSTTVLHTYPKLLPTDESREDYWAVWLMKRRSQIFCIKAWLSSTVFCKGFLLKHLYQHMLNKLPNTC